MNIDTACIPEAFRLRTWHTRPARMVRLLPCVVFLFVAARSLVSQETDTVKLSAAWDWFAAAATPRDSELLRTLCTAVGDYGALEARMTSFLARSDVPAVDKQAVARVLLARHCVLAYPNIIANCDSEFVGNECLTAFAMSPSAASNKWLAQAIVSERDGRRLQAYMQTAGMAGARECIGPICLMMDKSLSAELTQDSAQMLAKGSYALAFIDVSCLGKYRRVIERAAREYDYRDLRAAHAYWLAARSDEKSLAVLVNASEVIGGNALRNPDAWTAINATRVWTWDLIHTESTLGAYLERIKGATGFELECGPGLAQVLTRAKASWRLWILAGHPTVTMLLGSLKPEYWTGLDDRWEAVLDGKVIRILPQQEARERILKGR